MQRYTIKMLLQLKLNDKIGILFFNEVFDICPNSNKYLSLLSILKVHIIFNA